MKLVPGKLYKIKRKWLGAIEIDDIYLFVERKCTNGTIRRNDEIVTHAFLGPAGKVHKWKVSASKEAETIKINWKEA